MNGECTICDGTGIAVHACSDGCCGEVLCIACTCTYCESELDENGNCGGCGDNPE